MNPQLEERLRAAAVRRGVTPEQFVHAALLRQIIDDEARVRADSLRQEMAEAAADPLFLADVAEMTEAFAATDAESAGMSGHA